VDFIKQIIDIFIHLDKHLNEIIQTFGFWTYFILFVVIFCETGLVVTPFFPGDSLLFAAGALASIGSLKVEWLFIVLSLAAIAGDTVNYQIGYFIGPKVFQRQDSRFFKNEYLERTHRFYEKHGGKTIILARFIPIIRTFAPFVAGVGTMTYLRFLSFNVIGGVLWCAIFVFGGYYFGNIPFVKKNFSLVIMAIIFMSILPGIIGYLRNKFNRSRAIGEPK